MKVLVVDATHGGITLSEAFLERGEEVTCVDVHRTLTREQLERHSKKFRVERSMPDPSDFDLIVRPVHYPLHEFLGMEKRTITHHQAVRMLVERRINFPVVEITGSFGKTTAALCAISLLGEDRTILSLTSRGTTFTEAGKTKILETGVSAAPANIIRALNHAPGKPDLAIFELSLGGTGLADLGIIKNVYDDYPIAKGTSSALKAKLSMVNDRKGSSTVLVNYDDEKLSSIAGTQRFSPKGSPAEVKAKNVRLSPSGISMDAEFSGFRSMRGPVEFEVKIETERGPIGRQHVENLLVGASIAAYFGLDATRAVIPKEVFGRKMVLERESPPLVVNSSASIGAKAARASIADYLEIFPASRLEIGGRLKTTCGSADPRGVAEEINSSPFSKVSFFGEFGDALAPLIQRGVVYRNVPGDLEPTLRLERM
ncbi:MAG: hypothetical protein QFX35_00565 [Candidatus Verstraetearchaeota archaeon]|nr:hypothetical protein [Candidatus Verstraetearchaeota archaeon]